MVDFLSSAQPDRQRTRNGQCHTTQHKSENRCRHDALAEHFTGLTEIVGTDEMRYLHRESKGDSRGKRTEEPHGGFHQANGCRSLSTQ